MASTDELVELLIDGARFGDADDVHKALEGKVDVNAADEWGKTGGLGGLARCGWVGALWVGGRTAEMLVRAEAPRGHAHAAALGGCSAQQRARRLAMA